MASVVRRLRKHLRWRTPNSAQTIEQLEGLRLARRLEQAARAQGADPHDFLRYLSRMRRGYDPRNDGKSELMTLVDEIAAYELRAIERRKEAERGAAS